MLFAGCRPTVSEGPSSEEGEGVTPYQEFNTSFYNPLKVDYMLGDPWMVKKDDMYYFSMSGGDHVKVTRVTGITSLMACEEDSKTIFLGAKEGLTDLWASELHFYQGKWYCFFAADINYDNNLHRMYLLRSQTDDPMGDWDYMGQMPLPDGQWAIDGTFYEHKDGRIFLIWSGWRSELEGSSLWKQYLYITELAKGDPTTVIGTERVKISTPEHYWEISSLPQNEGPAMVTSPKGTVYCVYSANFSGSNFYALGALRLIGDDPAKAESWEKLPEPILSTDEDKQVYSPGHPSFTKSPDGTEDWIIYHANKAKDSGWDRSARAQKVEWIDDIPHISGGKPESINSPQPLPSGEIVDRISIEMEDGVLSAGTKLVEYPDVGKAVHFDGLKESAVISVSVKQEGRYALWIRHNNERDESGVWVAVGNASKKRVKASFSGGKGLFTMTCTTVELQKGLNTIAISAGSDVEVDRLILDRHPMAAAPADYS